MPALAADAAINWAAWTFGIAFIIQGTVVLFFGVVLNKINYRFDRCFGHYFAVLLVVLAIVAMPLLSAWLMNDWYQADYFGLTPAPLCLAAIGFCWLGNRSGFVLMPLPLLWIIKYAFMGFVLARSVSG